MTVPEPHLQIAITRLLTDEKGNAPVEIDVLTRGGTTHRRYKDINAAMKVVHRLLRNYRGNRPLFDEIPDGNLPSGFRPVAHNLMGDGELT